MEKEEILRNSNKDEALAKLYGHAGWLHLSKILEDKREVLLSELVNIDPENTARIAKIQGRLEIIREIINKPEEYFNKKRNNGGK